MNQIPTAPPSGFRDYLPDECALRTRLAATISEVYRAYGFQQIATSAVEDLVVLKGKGGGENEKLIFQIQKRGEKLSAESIGFPQRLDIIFKSSPKAGGIENLDDATFKLIGDLLSESIRNGGLTDLGLRFDLTLPLARYYSKYGSTLPNPFKAFHIAPVWRAERPQKGRYREFYQCDADIIGSDSIAAEIEVISAILAAFDAVGLPDVEVVLNDRSYVYAALAAAEVPEDKRVAACVVIDKLDKVPHDKILSELREVVGHNQTAHLQQTLLNPQPNRALMTKQGAFGGEQLAKLDQIVEAIGTKARIDPSLMRGFDYYTGPVFEFRHPKFKGSIGGGGRYDRLTEKFGGQAVPACGGSIGFERLLLILQEQEQAAPQGPDVAILLESESHRAAAYSLGRDLRRNGLTVDTFPGSGKLGKQMKYAEAKHARHFVIFKANAAAGTTILQKAGDNDGQLVESASLFSLISRRSA